MSKIKGPALPRIHTTGPTLPKVEASVVAQALGAEVTPIERPKPQAPLALFALRQGLTARLQSTGGRPGLGESRRQKIPLSDEDWAVLCELSRALADGEYRPTPGQVASELLHRRLQEIHDELTGQEIPLRDTGSQGR